MSTTAKPDAHTLLDAAYDELGLDEGALLPTADGPEPDIAADEWRSKGEWLLLGHRMGAEKIFFVDNDPVVLFSALPSAATETDVVATYRRAWSMGRARCLFVATDTELRVYALNEPPPRTLMEANNLRPIDYVRRASEVAVRLADYHRDRLESGAIFERNDYRNSDGRADRRLLEDVASATSALVENGLSRSIAHSLIERVILVRYLEDRNVIGPDYFRTLAEQDPSWSSAMQTKIETQVLGPRSAFVSCLSSHDLTYAIFNKLADTFNGDMFLVSNREAEVVTGNHLKLIQLMLTGAGFDSQHPLFLWAYDFSVVPTSLIGAMYEQFYRADADDKSSTHYTPQELAEYVVAQVLTPDVLARNPRICDPACGSGVFLVEAFRRIVRNEMAVRAGRLTSAHLKELLVERITGIDINQEAIRLAAFSLYLAYLNYQDPPDIAKAGPLPHLIYRTDLDPSPTVLVQADAFSPFSNEALTESFSDSQNIEDSTSLINFATLPWPAHTFDVIIGNPPWDEPREVPRTHAEVWADDSGFPVGDRSPSQLFLWRAQSLLKPNGVAALLVVATAFHNARSRAFRKQWLSRAKIVSITDFTTVRRFFFSASAPFALVIFQTRSVNEATDRLLYRSLRPSESLRNTRSMSYARSDRRWVAQDELYERDYLWKTYSWGGHRDASLMARLDLEPQLNEVIPGNPGPGWGYQYGDKKNHKHPSDYLASLPSLNRLELSGPLTPDQFEEPPISVKRSPDERRYSGQRILVSEGVRPGFGPVSRLVYDDFSFRHKIYCIPVPVMPAWRAKVILAILVSSLGRYRMFMRSGSWGLWRDKVNAEDILATPIRFPERDSELANRISELVDELTLDTSGQERQLQLYDFSGAVYFQTAPKTPYISSVPVLLAQISECIYDLFELSPAERDLINDFHRYTVDISGNWRRAVGLTAVKVPKLVSGTESDIRRLDVHPISDYLDRFLGEWNSALGPDGELSWNIISVPRSELVCAVFETRNREDKPLDIPTGDWASVLSRLQDSISAVGGDRIVRSVSDTSIVIVKRWETRLWSATAGREDAEATMLQAMTLQDA